MTDENRDPVTEDAGTGSDEARLFTPGNGSGPADTLTARIPGSRNRSEETAGSGEETDEEDLDDTVDMDAEEEDDEDLDEEDEDEEVDEDVDEDEDLLDEDEEGDEEEADDEDEA